MLTALALAGATQAQVAWDGEAGDLIWNSPLNWVPNLVPAVTDDVVFGLGTPGPIHLGENRTVNSLTFNEDFLLGDYGSNLTLTNSSGNVSVLPTVFATINAAYSGSNALNLSGGGSLFLNNPFPAFTGNINIAGPGTTLVFRADQPMPQYNGVGGASETGRGDTPSLGVSTAVKTLTLTNGGEFKYLGGGNNPEGNYKNIVIGTGGGAINLPTGFTVWNLDDVGQLSSAAGNTFTKRGNGRLTITGSMAAANPLAGPVVVDGGMLELGNVTTGRFTGMTTANTLTINNGVLMLNNGTAAPLDVATVNANNGAVLGINGQDHQFGLATGGSTLNIDGTVKILGRDLYGPQTQRFPRLHSDLTGSGTLELIPSTNNNSTSRLVIQRSTAGSTFTGTFRLTENMSLEAHPRSNATVDVGKVLAGGDVEFAGWASQLDIRDSDPAVANIKDYTDNELNITTTQPGNVNRISLIRATAATGTGHRFNFGTLTMGDHRLALEGNNSYMVGLADTARITGNALIEQRSAPLVFANPLALEENAAGRTLTLYRNGSPNSGAFDVTSAGNIRISNLNIGFGTLNLRGATGAIGTGFEGAATTVTINGGDTAAAGRGNGLQGLLHLDSNGSLLGVTAGNHTANNRIDDTATVRMLGNSILRLTSLNNGATTETVNTLNVAGGHALIDVVKSGTATAPVGFTFNTLNLTNGSTVNFTGTSLGGSGVNSSRILLPGTSTGFLSAAYHSGTEWVKYDSVADSTGVAIGVTPFIASDYTLNPTEDALAAGQQTKYTGATGITLTANRNTDRLNLQFSAANQAINTGGFILSLNQGGLITGTNTTGIIGTAGAGGITAGTTTPSQLYVHNVGTLELMMPVTDNLGANGVVGGGDDSAVDFVKSGTGTVVLSHPSRTVGQGQLASAPFTNAGYSGTLTGSWIINDGVLNVHRGQYLGGRPIVLNGGILEINQPASTANASSILPGWNNNVTVNGNATIGMDDNGESNDANVGGNTIALLGSLTINNNATLGFGAFNGLDVAFTGGGTLNGRGTINLGIGRAGDTNHNLILGGPISGNGGLNIISSVGTNHAMVLGGAQSDTTHNTFTDAIIAYGANATLRLNKANGFDAIPNTGAAEDLVINGSTVAWGPGHFGDLSTTNNHNVTNNGLFGIAPTSPVAIRNAGQNQINDNATVTLLLGTLGENDRINNDKWATLNQKNGTFNVGLGTIEVTTANISGGGFGMNSGSTFKAGTLNLLPGAYNPGITTGLPVPGAVTTLEIGAGGLNLTGQLIQLASGGSGNVAGAGAVLKLGGNVTVNRSNLLGASDVRTGIEVTTGSSFREIGGSAIDLLNGNRSIDIGTDVQFYITVPVRNGGLIKTGGGGLALENYQPSTFTGPVIVNAGVLNARADGAFGTSDGGVTINNGGTAKLESGWNYGDDFTVNGPGAVVPGESNIREVGALIAESGTSHLTGAVILGGAATLAGNIVLDPSVAPGAGGLAYRIGTLSIEGAGGVTGAGNLTLSGHGDGVIVNGVNLTSGAVTKDGAGRWTLSGAGSYTGATTVAAGTLRITNGTALGSTAGTTTVLGGALELANGIASAEPLKLYGAGASTQSGAVVNVSGNNTLSGAIQLGAAATLRSDSGLLALSGASITGSGTALTLSGAGNGSISNTINLGNLASNDALIKNGTGTWTINGGASFTGSTRVNGGTLSIGASSAVLSPTSALILAGGDVSVTGAAQTTGGLLLSAGGGIVNGGANGVNVGTIVRETGATANFEGTVNTTTLNTDGILGVYATFGGNDWATASGGVLAAFSNYAPLGSAAATSNALASGGQALAAPLTVNSLKIAGAGLAAAANDLTLSAGGLLYSGSGVSGIGGSGLISAGNPNSELIVTTSGGTLHVANPLIGAGSGSLTKAGSGNLMLRGTSAFTGAVNINDGTLSIAGPGGTTHPGVLGSGTGPRNINVNGGTFQLVGGDFNPNLNTMNFVIGSAGGTLRSSFGGTFTIDDANQLSGTGDLTLAGGGRNNFTVGGTTYPNFTGNVIVDGGFVNVSNSGYFGGRQEQTITLKPGSAIINQTGFGLGANGLPNNLILQGNTELFAAGGNRVYGGDIQLTGTNTIALMERDALQQERQVYLNGRVSGSGVTLNVVGVNNGNPFYLTSGSNNLTGTINLNSNTLLEARSPGSIGVNTGDVTVNLQGANSRLLLRHWQNGDYRANVNVSETAELNSDRLTGFGGGGSQILSVNNLIVSGTDKILTFTGGNSFTTRVGGTVTFNNNTIVNVPTAALLENGINFANGATLLDKRGGGSLILEAPSNNSGPTIVQGGFLLLQGVNGSLPSSNSIQLRGGELRVDNSENINTNRINDAGALVLGGGVLRITGEETLPTVTAASGTTQVIYNPTNETVASALTLTGFTRQLGAVVQFQSPDIGPGAVGTATFAQSRVSSRILIPGQANVTGTADTIPGLLGSGNLDFIQYDGTTMDNGQPLGVRDTRNPGSNTATVPVPYVNDTAETGWNDAIVLRSGAAATVGLTANRALDAWKIEQVVTLNQGAFNLRIENGGILAAGNASTINGTTGRLYAGKSVATVGTAELFIGGNNNLTVNSIISDNPESGQNVALVKTGTGALTLSSAAANTYTGGTYLNSGNLRVSANNSLGGAANTINLSGGLLDLFVSASAADANVGGFGQNIVVNANSTIQSDNGAATAILEGNYAFGGVNITGPYTLGLRGFDGTDVTFTGTHTMTGRPTLDMAQQGSGSNASVFTFNGNITGSGFFVSSSGNNNDTTGILQIGGGEAIDNTYSGKVTLLLGSNSEDMRVELNKAAGSVAITGDIEINGGILRNIADNQIADASNLVINQGSYDAFGKSETLASVTQRGGNFRTSSTASGGGTVTVTGDFNATGLDDLTGSQDGVATNSNTTLVINGTLRLNGYSRATVGGTASTLILGGLEMTGTTLTEGGAGSLVRLNGNVTTFASSEPARLGNTTTDGAQVQLNGTRTFTIADGGAGIDLSASTALVNAPATDSGLIKNGPGLLQLEGAGLVNAYTGSTTINEGTVVLFKNVGINALGNGAATNTLTIGDGVGGARADKLVLRNSNQIADTTNVTLAASGQIDLHSFNTSETIGSLAGSGSVDIGPGSAFVVNGDTSTLFNGGINGAGTFTKNGTSTLELGALSVSDLAGGTSVQGTGRLIVNGLISGSVQVGDTSTLGGIGTINGPVTIASGATVSPGNNSFGTLNTGAFDLQSGAAFTLGIANSSTYDTVNVTGGITLAGTLNSSITNGFTPSITDQFYLMINDGNDAVVGTFAGLPEGAEVMLGGTTLFITYKADFATQQFDVGNDVALVIPEPNAAAMLLAGLSGLLGLRRFRRRA